MGTPAATATGTAVPPAFSFNLDIGAVGVAGGATYADGAFSVRGSGAGIEGSVDAFHYIDLPLVGDGQIVARVTGQDSGNMGAKAGVMVRDTLDPSSPFASMMLTPGNGVVFQRRANPGAVAVDTALNGVAAPSWIKLTRTGSVLTGYISGDGKVWTLAGSGTVALHTVAYIGLAVTSRDNLSLNTAVFDHINIAGIGPAT